MILSQAFADDFKFIADLIAHSKEDVQAVVNIVAARADAHGILLSIEKCFVVYCGHHQPKREYYINSLRLKCMDSVRDLGLMRTYDGAYSDHCNAVISKTTKICGMLRHIYRSRHCELLWPAFTYYMRPILSYCTPAWNTFLKRDVATVERV